MRHVPLARRNLFQDRRRSALSIFGIAAALVLVLVLGGVFAGAMRQVTAYIRSSPADVFVAQRDVSTMHMTTSALAPDVVDQARAVDGVEWAEGLYYTTSTLDTGDSSLITYVFGYDTTTGRGGPRTLAAGRPPGRGEVVVDSAAAEDLGITLGETVAILGQPFTVSGLSTDGTSIANTTTYITGDDFAGLRGPNYGYVLVGAAPGVPADALRARLADALPDTTVLTKGAFERSETNIVRSMAADVMAIISTIGYLIALALIGLTLYNATVAKQRELGIVKALGAPNRRLTATVLAQAAWTVALSIAVAAVISVLLGRLIEAATTNIAVEIEPVAVARTALGAALIGAVAAVLPLRRVAHVDAATAFRMP